MESSGLTASKLRQHWVQKRPGGPRTWCRLISCSGNYEIIIVGNYEATSAFVGLLPAQAEARLSAVALGEIKALCACQDAAIQSKTCCVFAHVLRRLFD